MHGGKSAEKNLYEALDERGRPLCLLPLAEIQRQRLFHRAVALLLMDRQDRMLLQAGSDSLHDFSFYGAVPAGLGSHEFAGQLAFANWKVEKVLPLCEYRPCPENRYSFCAIFKLPVSRALAEMFAGNREKFLLADSVEMASLIQYGLGVSPFLKLFLERSGPGEKRKNLY